MVDDGLYEIHKQIDHATECLLRTARGLTDDDLKEPSLLPGWTRGHVLTHVARNADALRNLMMWARTGTETPAYPSQEARNAAIDAGASRGAAELLADLTESAAAFRAEAQALPDSSWRVPVRVLDYAEFPAAQVLTRRLVEVELHHTDLGTGYEPRDWAAGFAAMELPEPMRSQREDRIRREPRA